jgi:tetrahydromethanopterin S-methyltransferase subunit E
MKKRFLLAIIISYTATAVLAQHDHSNHQKQTTNATSDSTSKTAANGNSQQQLSNLLTSYYNIKNALVSGDAASASTNAEQFLRTANAIDFKVISEGNLHILSKDAGKISGTKDLSKQREYFAGLSSNMAEVARAVKLNSQPIYLQYCPMKKSLWLSSEKGIKNPYYGSSMLSCGEVRETL